MRKVAMWSCYSARVSHDPKSGVKSWAGAFGINSPEVQLNSFGWKNCGIFFNYELAFNPYGSANTPTDVEEVMASFDKWWVMGAFPFPGSASPNYSEQFAFDQTRGSFPELDKAGPVLIGFPLLPYAGVYDDELSRLDIHHVIR